MECRQRAPRRRHTNFGFKQTSLSKAFHLASYPVLDKEIAHRKKAYAICEHSYIENLGWTASAFLCKTAKDLTSSGPRTPFGVSHTQKIQKN